MPVTTTAQSLNVLGGDRIDVVIVAAEPRVLHAHPRDVVTNVAAPTLVRQDRLKIMVIKIVINK